MDRQVLGQQLTQALDTSTPDLDRIRSLLALGADANTITTPSESKVIARFGEEVLDGAANVFGASVLAVACICGNEQAIRILLAAGADPTKGVSAANNHLDPLTCVCAVYGGWEEGVPDRAIGMVKLLVQHGADTSRSRALYYVASIKTELYSYLLQHPQDPALLGQLLCSVGSFEAGSMLIEAGADVNAEHNAMTPLIAAAAGDPRLVEHLLSRGADASKFSSASPMWRACRYGKPETIRLLCAHGVPVNIGDLHAALDYRKDETILTLMEEVHKRGKDLRKSKLRSDHGTKTLFEFVLRNDFPRSASFMFEVLGEDLHQTLPGGADLLQICGPNVRNTVLSLRTQQAIDGAISDGAGPRPSTAPSLTKRTSMGGFSL